MNENYGLKALLCMRIALRVNQKSIKWTWAKPFEMNAKVELVLSFVVDNEPLLLQYL